MERAMSEFLLRYEELDGLKRTSRRSPYAGLPEIVVLWRKDVVQRAIQVWGSLDKMRQERQRQSRMRKRMRHSPYITSTFGHELDERPSSGSTRGHQSASASGQPQVHAEAQARGSRHSRPRGRAEVHGREPERGSIHTAEREGEGEGEGEGELADPDFARAHGLCSRGGAVVVFAVSVNVGMLVLKIVAWQITGSYSMFAEAVHSMADTANQLIMAVGVHASTRGPTEDHPYGYSSMKFVTALIAGVGVFCVGTGLSMYHGVVGLLQPHDLHDAMWGIIVLGVSGATETASLCLAVRSLYRSAKERNMPLCRFIFTSQEPSVNVVFTEDMAAVLSLVVASVCMLLSFETGSNVPDAVGSLLVGVLLGAVASFIIYTNVGSLVGRSIPAEQLDRINAQLEADVMVREIHDVKGIDMGNNMVRYKAELDFDGRQLTRAYLDTLDTQRLLKEVSKVKNAADLEEFMLLHGENIVDLLGVQIDRIERKLKKREPYIRHCDLEIL